MKPCCGNLLPVHDHAPFRRLLLHRATAADDEHVKMSLLCGLIAAIAAIDLLLLLLLLQRHARY